MITSASRGCLKEEKCEILKKNGWVPEISRISHNDMLRMYLVHIPFGDGTVYLKFNNRPDAQWSYFLPVFQPQNDLILLFLLKTNFCDD